MTNQNLTTFYIIRHGETDWNVQHRIQGHTDIPLNENGRAQAKEAARLLKDVKFDLAFSSDLLRAKETAEIVALEHNLEVTTTQLLRERKYGEMEGKNQEAFRAFDELFKTLSDEEKNKFKYSSFGENNEEIIVRFITFIRETAVTHPGKTILVGTHGSMMAALLIHLGILSRKDPRYSINNGAYVKLLSDGVEFVVKETHGIDIPKEGSLKNE
ncbi:MAG TPA: histidine phosphatase family protein [Patescibacteria group bacterium]|nr:histidine phosphatase family protein [Patescibacteria group bacterium]